MAVDGDQDTTPVGQCDPAVIHMDQPLDTGLDLITPNVFSVPTADRIGTYSHLFSLNYFEYSFHDCC